MRKKRSGITVAKPDLFQLPPMLLEVLVPVRGIGYVRVLAAVRTTLPLSSRIHGLPTEETLFGRGGFGAGF